MKRLITYPDNQEKLDALKVFFKAFGISFEELKDEVELSPSKETEVEN
ncbi:DUF2683 family protein [Mucilaginibacter glaciei]|uniref:Uncharacterized protein n=1 Tax=Mucilaginibacter glaciei TaxID=2772109 RepID=A0A926NPK2_9SPHI|nr:DUF2683 family protein [Mucilaginibacter glaciei]MBD1392717.1 hypothetical protein [Mucilaginibacter glaciei]